MIIYFCDRQLNILAHATTVLPAGNRILDDKTTEDVETGVNSFECSIAWDAGTRQEVENAVQAGNYILKKGNNDGYDSLYQIIETESDTLAQEVQLYAEDAGLDLINTICPAVTLTNKNIRQMLAYFLPSDWVINIQDAPSTTQTYKWEGESTCTERIRSVVSLWNCELYYSFTIEELQVKEKIVNIVRKRGLQEAIPQLRLNYDIDRIVTKTSIASLVTALNVTGGTPEGSETPINLKNYTYSYTDPVTGDLYQVDKPTGQMRNITAMDRWSSAIDRDGLLVGSYSYDTTNKAVLAGQARAELQKLSAPAVNYEVDFATLPEDAQIGDRVNIIDDDGELYLEARILLIETCEDEGTKKATIGEYLLKTHGISEQVLRLAAEFQLSVEQTKALADSVTILTETVDAMLTLEVQSRVNYVGNTADLTAHLYNGDKEVTMEHSPALYKWILRKDTGEVLLGRGYTFTVDLAQVGYAGTILCRFIRPELYDLTDHNLIPITDQDGNVIQVSYAGVRAEPVIQRNRKFMALNKASNSTNVLRATAEETGYPTLAREVNLYERGHLDRDLKGTLQYFWTEQSGTDAGAHITEVTKEEYQADPSSSGGNLLAKSDGVYIRDGVSDLATFTGNGMKIYNEGTELASFRADGATIGQTNAPHIDVSPTDIMLYSDVVTEYFKMNGNGLNLYSGLVVPNAHGSVRMAGHIIIDPSTGVDTNGSMLDIRNRSTLSNGQNKAVRIHVDAGSKDATITAEVIQNGSGTRSSSLNLEADKIYASTNIIVGSDRRIKEHIKDLDQDGAEFCRNLRPVVYRKDGEVHLGFYAQDVQEANRWNAEITPVGNKGYMGLSYTELIAPLVAYCQTLEKRIEELEGK